MSSECDVESQLQEPCFWSEQELGKEALATLLLPSSESRSACSTDDLIESVGSVICYSVPGFSCKFYGVLVAVFNIVSEVSTEEHILSISPLVFRRSHPNIGSRVWEFSQVAERRYISESLLIKIMPSVVWMPNWMPQRASHLLGYAQLDHSGGVMKFITSKDLSSGTILIRTAITPLTCVPNGTLLSSWVNVNGVQYCESACVDSICQVLWALFTYTDTSDLFYSTLKKILFDPIIHPACVSARRSQTERGRHTWATVVRAVSSSNVLDKNLHDIAREAIVVGSAFNEFVISSNKLADIVGKLFEVKRIKQMGQMAAGTLVEYLSKGNVKGKYEVSGTAPGDEESDTSLDGSSNEEEAEEDDEEENLSFITSSSGDVEEDGNDEEESIVSVSISETSEEIHDEEESQSSNELSLSESERHILKRHFAEDYNSELVDTEAKSEDSGFFSCSTLVSLGDERVDQDGMSRKRQKTDSSQ